MLFDDTKKSIMLYSHDISLVGIYRHLFHVKIVSLKRKLFSQKHLDLK